MAREKAANKHNGAKGSLWPNLLLIALAHVVLIAGLIRWSQAARVSSNSESIVWLGTAGDLASAESEKQESSPPERVTPPPEPISKNDEVEQEKRVVAAVKSEVELPSETPKPAPTATARPKTTPTPAPKAKLSPKPTPKKTVVAKKSPKPVAKAKPSPVKSTEKSEKKPKMTLAKKEPASHRLTGQNESTAKRGSAAGRPSAASANTGGNSASEFGWYGNMLHDRFYSAWIQPTAKVPSGEKISTLVAVRIEKDGRVSKFEIVRPCGNVTVNESVRAIAKQVSQVDAPPIGLIKGDHYDVKINFELNTEDSSEN